MDVQSANLPDSRKPVVAADCDNHITGQRTLKSGPPGAAGAASKPQVAGSVAGATEKDWKSDRKPAFMEGAPSKIPD
jgi:hypothetical protein